MAEELDFLSGIHVNDRQREAITFEGPGPLLVLAGPGSGKTFVITQRVQYLIKVKKVAPEKILVLTFTRDAAQSMKERYLNMNSSVKHENVSQGVKQSDVSQGVKHKNVSQTVNFGTFHSIFYQILKQSTNLQEQRILSDAEKKRFLQPVVQRVLPDLSYLEKNNLWLELLPAISYYKNTGRIEHALRSLPAQAQARFQDIYDQYEQERRNAGKLDFDDMLIDCKSLLNGDAAKRKFWQERFDEILIDEFQDINPAQYEVIKLLLSPQKNIFAVGDDDQSIYGFRGADPGCMKRFEQEFHAKKVVLDINYRSNPAIVEASSKLIGHNRDRFAKKVHSYMEERDRNAKMLEQDGVFQMKFQQKEAMKDYLIKTCKEYAGQDQGKKLVILFRTNRIMQRYAMTLRQNGIKFSMRDQARNPYENEYVLDILAYLKLSRDPHDQESLLRIINKPSRYVKREAIVQCNDWRSLERCEKLKKQTEFLRKLSPYTAVQFIRRAVGYEEYLMEELENSPSRREEAKEILDWLTEEVKEVSDLETLLETAKSRENKGFSNNDYTSQNINLMTIHASKGLEFDHVILPEVHSRIYPHGVMLDQKSLEEERRIFYVAMTRAARRLDLLYLAKDRDRETEPSMFLREF